MKKTKIYTHDIAAQILENFEDALTEQNVILKSPEDNDKEPDNNAALYGSVYSDLLDATEDILIEMLKQIGVDGSEYKTSIFSGNY